MITRWGKKNKNSEKYNGVEFHTNEVQRLSKNRWADEVSNNTNTLKAKNWTYLVKDRKTWYEQVQKCKTRKKLKCRGEKTV
jgi:hypothetical protein